jgi:hypothetical protein
MGKLKILCFLLPFALQACRQAEETLPAQRQDARARLAVPLDGFYTANIATPLGKFQRSVVLKDGAIECIRWSSAADCSPFQGEMGEDGRINGTLPNGLVAQLELVDDLR